MKYEFYTYPMVVDDHEFWVAKSKSLKGCVGQGDTVQEAISELEENENEWLESAAKYNIAIPNKTVTTEKSYSGKLALRMSPFLHEDASRRAEELGISLNQYVSDAIAHYNAAIDARYRVSIPDLSQTTSDIKTEQTYSNNLITFPKQINIKELEVREG